MIRLLESLSNCSNPSSIGALKPKNLNSNFDEHTVIVENILVSEIKLNVQYLSVFCCYSSCIDVL